MPSMIDLTGQRFGRLTVEGALKMRTSCGHLFWWCKCDCGRKQVKVLSSNLRNGYTRSCGCLTKERMRVLGRANIKHGENDKNSRLYVTWINLKRKCYNPNALNYDKYGGRGVRICKEWLGKRGYINFRTWALNNGYSPSLRNFVIDRINLRGGFSPTNCRFTTKSKIAKRIWRKRKACVAVY